MRLRSLLSDGVLYPLRGCAMESGPVVILLLLLFLLAAVAQSSAQARVVSISNFAFTDSGFLAGADSATFARSIRRRRRLRSRIAVVREWQIFPKHRIDVDARSR